MKNLSLILSVAGVFMLCLFMSDLNVYAKSNESVITQVESIVEEYGFIPEENIRDDGNELLEFDTVEEFEKFLSKEKEALEKSELSFAKIDYPISVFDDGPYFLTYKTVSSTGFEKITGYARVKRESAGYIMDVEVWSEQTGLVNVIEWQESNASYTTTNNNKNGRATINGVRYYHVSVSGIPIGFKKSTVLKIDF